MRLLTIAGLVSALGYIAQAQIVTVPQGTRIPLGLTSPLSTRTARVGDAVRAETAFPVAVGATVAIPTGTYVEGAIDKVKKRGRDAGFDVHFTRILFANGYTAPVSGSTTAPLTASLARPELPGAVAAGMAGSFQSSCPLPPCMSATPTLTQPSMPGPRIGLFIGIAAAGAAMIATLIFSRRGGGGLYLDAGSALEMVLVNPLSLDAAKLPATQ